MNARSHTLEIDGIVLEGLDVTPKRAERIQALVDRLLHRRLEEEGVLERAAGGNVSLSTSTPPGLDLLSLDDQDVAEIIVRHIIQSLHDAIRRDTREDSYD